MKPSHPLRSTIASEAQLAGMTSSAPFQYIQNARVVRAPAAVLIARPVTSIVPPGEANAAALQVAGLGALPFDVTALTEPVATPSRVPAASAIGVAVVHASLNSQASTGLAGAPALMITVTAAEVALALVLSVTLAVSA